MAQVFNTPILHISTEGKLRLGGAPQEGDFIWKFSSDALPEEMCDTYPSQKWHTYSILAEAETWETFVFSATSLNWVWTKLHQNPRFLQLCTYLRSMTMRVTTYSPEGNPVSYGFEIRGQRYRINFQPE